MGKLRIPEYAAVDNLLPLRIVEQRLGVSRWTLYLMIKKGTLPAVRLPSGQYRVPEEELDKLVQAREEGGTFA